MEQRREEELRKNRQKEERARLREEFAKEAEAKAKKVHLAKLREIKSEHEAELVAARKAAADANRRAKKALAKAEQDLEAKQQAEKKQQAAEDRLGKVRQQSGAEEQ